MTEKEKAKKVVRPKPDIGEKVQPKEISDKHALRNKFMEHVQRWSKALGVDVKVDWKGEKQLSPEENLGMKDGVLYVRESAINEILKTPNILVGHEDGHELERKHKGVETTRALRRADAYITPGFKDPTKKHSCPPFGPTMHHDIGLRRVFDKEYTKIDSYGKKIKRNYLQDVGYNARQIYADSVPIKEVMLEKELIFRKEEEKPIPGRTMAGLMDEYITLLNNQYQSLSEEIRGEGEKIRLLEHVPALARFTASAWALRKIAGAWIKNIDKAQKIQTQLEGFSRKFGKLLEEPESIFGSELGEKEIQELLETPMERYRGPELGEEPRISGLSKEQIEAIGVLTRAYKQHFINCISRKELLGGEDLRPHLEKLKSPDEYMRRREAYTLGEIRNVKTLNGLIERLEDREETEGVKIAAMDAMEEIVRANPGHNEVFKHLPRLVEHINVIFKDEDSGVQYFTIDSWGRVVEANPGDKRVLESLPKIVKYFDNPNSKVQISALNAWGATVRANPGNEKVLKYLPQVVRHFDDEDPSVRHFALDAWGWVTKANPGNEEVLKYLPQVIGHFNDKHWRVRHFALDAWRFAVNTNPGDKRILDCLPKIVEYFDDPKTRKIAVEAWEITNEINAYDPRILETIDAYEAAAKKLGRKID